MKVLFITSKTMDVLASCLYDGIQEVLGEENVVDAVGCPWLHKSEAHDLCVPDSRANIDHRPVVTNIGASREGKRLREEDKGSFDLLILHSSFNRDHGWDWARGWRGWLKPEGKVAYVEGWDAAWQIHPPEMPVDVVFRKEISKTVQYPYEPLHLSFAMPFRCFFPGAEVAKRHYDLSFVGNPDACHPAHPVRWPALAKVFQTKRTHYSVIATRGLGFDAYYDLLRESKLALCPASADDADSLRTYEAVACGAIPIFVGYPDHIRDPWFPDAFHCTVETLADHIDEALGNDLSHRRHAMMQHAYKHHTTGARVKRLLEAVS